MPQVKGAPQALNDILESAYAAALKKYPGNKTKASKIAWAAVKNAGWHKTPEGKWVKKKKEMSEPIVIDAFKAGEYPQGTFTGKELQEIAETYDPTVYEAPITIGHVSDPAYKGKTTIPAFGWIGKVKVVGDHLKLIASEFSDQLKNLIKEGLYKKVSAAFFQPSDPNNPTPGKWHLHHLAFLGAVPPAVKGLEGLAFAEMKGAGVVFADMVADVGEDDGVIEEVESLGTDDTLKEMTEYCATFLQKVEDVLNGDTDDDTKRNRIMLAASDLSMEIQDCVNLHFTFLEKLDDIEDQQEMAEKKHWLVELAGKLIHKRKEVAMDAAKEREYQERIAALEAQNKEFAEKERLANEAKAKAEAEAREAALTAEVKAFCDVAVKEHRMTPAMREADEKIMVNLAKVSPEALKSFQEKYSAPIVPKGVLGDLDKPQKTDLRPQVIRDAEKYVKERPTEFAGLSHAEALSRALFRHSIGEIQFEGEETILKGA
jgi:cation transport regulator ChaB